VEPKKGSSIWILIVVLIIFIANWYFVAFVLNPFGVPGLRSLLTPVSPVAIKLESLWDSYAEGLKLSAYDGVSL
jgi:hypothetical protein